MQPTKLDLLFASKAMAKEINARVKELEDECKAELLEEYETSGNDRKRSPFFGKEAGYIGVQEGKPSEKVTRFQMVDADAVIDWMDATRPETDSFATANLAQFAEWWFEHMGEVPDGCTVITYDSEPGRPIVKLVVKEQVVLPKLAESHELKVATSTLMLGDGSNG